jgi:hypothetical protein
VARIVIGVLAADAALLFSGFFVRSTSAPLLASIGLSVVVTVLIVYGLVKQFREHEGLESDGEPEIEELEVDDATTEFSPDEIVATPARRRVRPRVTRPKPAPQKAPPKKARTQTVAARERRAKPRRAAPASTRRVCVVPGASKYHRHDCRYAQGPDVREVSEATAIDRGYARCGVCKP